MFGEKNKQPKVKEKRGIINPDSILKGEITLDELAEPYVIMESSRSSMDKLSYCVNLFAREKGYRITSFDVTDYLAYAIMEKKTTTNGASSSSTPEEAARVDDEINKLKAIANADEKDDEGN
jgi:hypothetical protein